MSRTCTYFNSDGMKATWLDFSERGMLHTIF
ncbi:hypothetical protein EDB95_2338 [Dinghuibacter silviterrae]|uniref:Uncharacterized protein n=1 Tax=Dinghuibacter silviterrae TaxID=1539049 RepID=A0A4R8DV12_9BACT|nr:hypothetical protein EDB95_2338 [Dinghuibacter silviterrae]